MAFLQKSVWRIGITLNVCATLLAGCTQEPQATASLPAPITVVASQLPNASPLPSVTAIPSATPRPPTATARPLPSATVAPSVTSIPPAVTAVLPTATASEMPSATRKSTNPPRATAIIAQPTASAPQEPTTHAPENAPATGQHAHIFPVQSSGKVSYGSYHHDYPAADIFCPIGSRFVAPTDGVIDYVSREDTWNPQVNSGDSRGGLSVALIGDDGVRYYGSHLSAIADGIAPGVRVTGGQLLGLTGKSGDARYVQPHLHFGISHPTAPDDWAVRRGEVQPAPYLRAWQRGEDVTPKVP